MEIKPFTRGVVQKKRKKGQVQQTTAHALKNRGIQKGEKKGIRAIKHAGLIHVFGEMEEN